MLRLDDIAKSIKTLRDNQRDYVSDKYQDLSLPKHIEFATSREDVFDLMLDFVKQLPNEKLREDLLTNIQGKNPNVIVRIVDREQDRYHGQAVTGRITERDMGEGGFNRKDLGKTKLIIDLGRQLDGKLITTMNKLEGGVHESFHSISEKHNKANPDREKEQRIGEIEAMFGEKLFYSYLVKNAKQLYQETGAPESYFTRCAEDYKKSRDIGLVQGLDDCINPNLSEQERNYRSRYVIGELYSTVLANEYASNPAETLDRFTKFYENNSHMDFDEAAKSLFDGKYNSLTEVVSAYLKLREKEPISD